MYKTYRFRLYPNINQEILINKTFGCTRYIYNYFLNKCKENKYIKAYDMCNEIKELAVEYPFLKEVDSCSLRCSVFDLEDAYKNFFDKRGAFPNFKKKFDKQSYRTSLITSTYKGKTYENIKLDLKNKIITLPKLKEIKIRGYRNIDKIDGRIINATVTREKTGKYYVSVLVEENIKIEKKKIF